MSEIITKPPRIMDFDELSYWLDKHSITNEVIGSYNIFKPEMRWTQLSKLYADLKEIKTYISDYLNEIEQASSSIDQINNELVLIDWILKYETLYEEAPFELRFSFVKEDDRYILNSRDKISFRGERFILTFNVINFYQENYDNLLRKYNTYTPQEENELHNEYGYGKDKADIFSLRFHLENRKVMEEFGLNLPFYIIQRKMPF